ncbi:MAG: DUF2784 domain-containing protein [Gammaproteobacteria bacterium]
MHAKIAADITLLVHFAFILFAVFGGLIVLYRPLVAWLHVPVVLWAAAVNLFGQVCPLTPLENAYRIAAGQAGYEGGFVEHYIAPLIYPRGLSYELGVILGIMVLAWNMLIYAFVLHRKRHGH